MKRSLLGVAACCAFVASASVAQAQNMSPVKFGVSAGVSVPSGDFGDFAESGYNITGHLGFMAPMIPVGLRADVSYNKFGEKGDSPFESAILAGTVNGVFNLSAGMPASPYVLAGVGAYRQKATVTDNCDIGFFDCNDVTETDVGINGGLGMKFNLSGFSTFAEVRYHYIFNEGDSKTSFIPISFGIMF